MMRKISMLCVSLMIAMTAMAEWTLVTDASTLQAGDQLVFAYADATNNKYVTATATISKSSSTNYLGSVTSTFSADKSELTALGENTAVFTLGGQEGAWTLTEATNGILGATALKKIVYASNAATNTWTISVSNNVAVVASTNSNFGQIRYNYNQGNMRFTNYSASGLSVKDILLYVQVFTPSYALSYKGYPYKKIACEEPTYKAGQEVKLTSGVPVEEGKEFLGWTYGDVTYAPGATFVMPEENVELVPCWKQDGTGIEDVQALPTATKSLRDGHLYIIRDGVIYNALGARVK